MTEEYGGKNIISLDDRRDKSINDPLAPPSHMLRKHREHYSEMWFQLGEIAKQITDINDSETLLEINHKINEIYDFVTQHTK